MQYNKIHNDYIANMLYCTQKKKKRKIYLKEKQKICTFQTTLKHEKDMT